MRRDFLTNCVSVSVRYLTATAVVLPPAPASPYRPRHSPGTASRAMHVTMTSLPASAKNAPRTPPATAPDDATPSSAPTPAAADLFAADPAATEPAGASSPPRAVPTTAALQQALLQYLAEEGKSAAMTAKQWQQQQERINRLLQQGEIYRAYPLQCSLAHASFSLWGADHPDTWAAVFAVSKSLAQRNAGHPDVSRWLLARAVEVRGLHHAETREAVQLAATCACITRDLRPYPGFLQLLTDAALQLPGGVGWGSTIVAPVSDEEGFHRHAVMQGRANWLVREGKLQQQCDKFKLAKDMFQRCVTYYESLGQHWLATRRKIDSIRELGMCMSYLDDHEKAERLLYEGKCAAQRELGRLHDATLHIQYAHAHTVASVGRQRQGLCHVQKLIRLRKDTLGPMSDMVLVHQVRGQHIYASTVVLISH